jgi:hypothetical protein
MTSIRGDLRNTHTLPQSLSPKRVGSHIGSTIPASWDLNIDTIPMR